MKKKNRGLYCYKLGEAPRFGCSDEIYKLKTEFKKKKLFRTNKKY